jgi:hypothetical protein
MKKTMTMGFLGFATLLLSLGLTTQNETARADPGGDQPSVDLQPPAPVQSVCSFYGELRCNETGGGVYSYSPGCVPLCGDYGGAGAASVACNAACTSTCVDTGLIFECN